jgi:Na+/melibiose symporter-like transporter
MILSAAASGLGAIFFTLIQGTVFNFFLEDLKLRDRLPYFMGLWCIASLGTVIGSWIQQRWGCRRALFMWGIGGSRIVWLVIGVIPLVRPEWLKSESAFVWLSVLTLLFYFVHSLGATAWLTWMADLVPANLQSKYWSLRQVGCSGASVVARLAGGYFLDAHHNWNGYAAIFICAAVIGIVDPLIFFAVHHRRPKMRPITTNIFVDFTSDLRQAPFRRLCGVYLLWSVSNCIMGPTCYYFMRDEVGMGVASFAVVEAIALAGFTAFSFLWGRLSDHHGHRGPLVLCLLLQTFCPIFYFLAGPRDVHHAALAWTIGAIGFCGIQLFMWPMLIQYTSVKGRGREMGTAAFNVLLGFANFAAFMAADRWLYELTGSWIGAPAQSTRVYLIIMGLCMVLRGMAAGLACLLPRAADETTAREVITQVVTTNPLRAGLSFLRYITGQEMWQEVTEDEDGDAPQQAKSSGNGEGGQSSVVSGSPLTRR